MTAPDQPDEAVSDAVVIAASVREPACFAAIFDRHYGAIASYLRWRVDRTLADELASETFVRAFAHRDRYDRARPDAGPWLYGIATNLLRKHSRAEERRRRAYARAAEADVFGGGLDDADARIDAAAGQRWQPRLRACSLWIRMRCCCAR